MIMINLEKAKQIAIKMLTPETDTPEIRAAIMAAKTIQELKLCCP